jgi:hypothetical protein
MNNLSPFLLDATSTESIARAIRYLQSDPAAVSPHLMPAFGFIGTDDGGSRTVEFTAEVHRDGTVYATNVGEALARGR